MKTLFLVRHAKSSWDHPELHDADRPLNKRGIKDAPTMGSRLKDRKILPDLLISSQAVRALETAKYIAEAIGYPKNKILVDERLYHASTMDFLSVINSQSDTSQSLMLFSHNPGLTSFANKFCTSFIDNIVTTGVYAIRFSVASWRSIAGEEKGELLFYDYPKKGN